MSPTTPRSALKDECESAGFLVDHLLGYAARPHRGTVGLDVDVAPGHGLLAEATLNRRQYNRVTQRLLVEHGAEKLGGPLVVGREIAGHLQKDVSGIRGFGSETLNAQQPVSFSALGINDVVLDVQRR